MATVKQIHRQGTKTLPAAGQHAVAEA